MNHMKHFLNSLLLLMMGGFLSFTVACDGSGQNFFPVHGNSHTTDEEQQNEDLLRYMCNSDQFQAIENQRAGAVNHNFFSSFFSTDLPQVVCFKQETISFIPLYHEEDMLSFLFMAKSEEATREQEQELECCVYLNQEQSQAQVTAEDSSGQIQGISPDLAMVKQRAWASRSCPRFFSSSSSKERGGCAITIKKRTCFNGVLGPWLLEGVDFSNCECHFGRKEYGYDRASCESGSEQHTRKCLSNGTWGKWTFYDNHNCEKARKKIMKDIDSSETEVTETQEDKSSD